MFPLHDAGQNYSTTALASPPGCARASFPVETNAQVWQLHARIKFYMILTAIGIIVDLAIGIGGVVYVLHERYKVVLIAVTWTMRHVHIALDTLVLYGALGVTSSADKMVRWNVAQVDRVTPRKRRSGSRAERRRGTAPHYASTVSPA